MAWWEILTLTQYGEINITYLIKKNLLIILFIFSLLGCNTLDKSRIAPGYTEAFRTINNAIFGFPDDEISSSVIKNIPYASSLLKIGKGPKGLLILEKINKELETWVSGDGIKVFIRNGRVVRTSGLTNNLTDYLAPKNKKLNRIEVRKYINYRSYDNPRLINLEIQSSIESKGKRLVKLHNGEKLLELVEEEISSRKLGWTRVNKYWIDDMGFVWKSHQYISPKLPRFEIEVTKKPS